MKKLKWVLGGVALVVLVGLCANLMDDTDTPVSTAQNTEEPAAPVATPDWTEIASWSGSGIKETETFTTNSREWRIVWESRDPDGLIQVYAYSGDNKIPHVAVNQLGAGSDVSYVRTDPGPHYLNINGIGDWTVSVEDQR